MNNFLQILTYPSQAKKSETLLTIKVYNHVELVGEKLLMRKTAEEKEFLLGVRKKEKGIRKEI